MEHHQFLAFELNQNRWKLDKTRHSCGLHLLPKGRSAGGLSWSLTSCLTAYKGHYVAHSAPKYEIIVHISNTGGPRVSGLRLP